jgi:hypothetical protein
MNTQISDYINNAVEQHKLIMTRVRAILHEAVPGVKESYKWSRPVFGTTRDFAYLKTAKNHVTLGFYNFRKLVDKNNLLEGAGKDLRHIKIKTVGDIDENLLKEWFQALAG